MTDSLQHWIIKKPPKEPTEDQRKAIEECIKGFDIMFKVGKVYEIIPFQGWSHILANRNCADQRWVSICEHYDFTGKSVLDLGGNYGYMAFRALAAGATRAVVIDRESTEIAAGPLFAEAYGYDNIEFILASAPDALDALEEQFDCAFAFSMFGYIRYQGGDSALDATVDWLAKNVREVVFVEPQKAGDSVGPPQWKDDATIIRYFENHGFQDCRIVGEGFPAGLGVTRSMIRLSTMPNPLEFKDYRSLDITEHSLIHGGDGKRVVKWQGNTEQIRKEFEMLRKLSGPGFPRAIEFGHIPPAYIVMTDVGERRPITDMEKVRASADAIVEELERAGIQHGDIGEWNVVINDNIMHLLDFGNARYMGDDGYVPRSGGNKGNMAIFLKLLEKRAHRVRHG